MPLIGIELRYMKYIPVDSIPQEIADLIPAMHTRNKPLGNPTKLNAAAATDLGRYNFGSYALLRSLFP